jgi:hypothetical protein
VANAMQKLDPKSSPGYPYMRLGRTNGDVLAAYSSLIEDLAVRRLKDLWEADLEELAELSAQDLVDCGYCDPIRVFVKNELHGKIKVAQGRMRLIMSVSVVDQLVERVLNGAQNNCEISKWEDIPSKPGMGLGDEGLLTLQANFKAMQNPLSSDISGFDWSVSAWWLDCDARARAMLTGLGHDMHRKRAMCLGRSLLVFSDGVVWAQTVDGVQKSGSYNTSSTNSRIRYMLAALVAKRGGWDGAACAMGDDAVEDSPDEDLAPAYLQLGFRLKEVSRELEFCAYRFDLCGGFEPVRWHKMLANLLWTKPRDTSAANELLVALRHELRHSPHLSRAEEIITAVGWGSGN